MTLQIRRLVTGHDAQGKAKVLIDDVCGNVSSSRPGQSATVVWTSDKVPADNNGEFDASTRKVSTSEDGGTVFRVVRYEPGVSPRNHRTDSIDYAVVMAGEIDMDLDGTMVRLKAGDVLVQRGTIHNWVNRGKEACVIAFVLVGAHPVRAGGKTLNAVG